MNKLVKRNKYALVAVGTAVGIVGIMRFWAAEVYDTVILSMTRKWYKQFLERVRDGEKVHD